MSEDITPEMLLQAYAAGIFPMAEAQDDPDVFWVDPLWRGIIPLDKFHISRSLSRQILRENFQIRTNTSFDAVVCACANRPDTWISGRLFELYRMLHEMGYAHSLEVWNGPDLVGGVYGVALGGAFFGESMFSRQPNASKIALAYLVDRLRKGGFTLFDTQFLTPHLASLGGIEISQKDYRTMLRKALAADADFNRAAAATAQGVIQRNTQTS